MSAADAFVRLVHQLALFGYLEPLAKVEQQMGGELWLFGGWVRAAAIGAPHYAGDLDCMVVNPAASAPMGVVIRNFSGGLRVRLDDGNHLDIKTLNTFGGNQVLDVLQTFAISANAVAVRLSDGAVVACEGSLDDLRDRILRVRKKESDLTQNLQASLLFAYDALVQLDGFTPATDGWTLAVQGELQRRKDSFQKGNFQSLIQDAAGVVRALVPQGAQSWIVRGYARCAIRKELCYWDDIDVIADASRDNIIAHLNWSGANYVINFYGNPKVRISDGRTVDIWSRGQDNIFSQLDAFEFNVDCVAVEVGADEALVPAGLDIFDRKLRLRRADLECDPYIGVKATYLCIRHNLSAGDERTLRCMRQQINPNGFLSKNIYRLCRELTCTSAPDLLARLQRLSAEIGTASIIDWFREILDPNENSLAG